MYSITVHLDNGSEILLSHMNEYQKELVISRFHDQEVGQCKSYGVVHLVNFAKVTHISIMEIK